MSGLSTMYLGAKRRLRITVTDTSGEGLAGTTWLVAVVPAGTDVTAASFTPATEATELDPTRVRVKHLHTPEATGDFDVLVRAIDADEDDWVPAGTLTVR